MPINPSFIASLSGKWIVYVLRTPISNKPEGRLYCGYAKDLTQRLKDHLTPIKAARGSAAKQRKQKVGTRTFTALEVVWLGEAASGEDALRLAEAFTLLDAKRKNEILTGKYDAHTLMFKRISLEDKWT